MNAHALPRVRTGWFTDHPRVVQCIAQSLVALALFASDLWAADRVEKGTVLTIDLAKGVIIQSPGNGETDLADANTFTTRRNETVRVVILRQNPLLFTYEAVSEKSDTPEYAAALELGKQLQLLLALFPSSGASGIRGLSIQGVDPEQLRKDIELIRSLFDSLSADLALSLGGASQTDTLKQKYADADIEGLVRRIEGALRVMSAVVSHCDKSDETLSTDGGQPVSCTGPLALEKNADLTHDLARLRLKQAEAERYGALLDEADKALIAAKADAEAAVKGKNKAEVNRTADAVKKAEGGVEILRKLKVQAETEAAAQRAALQEQRNDPALRPTLEDFARRAEAIGALLLRQLDTLKAVSADVASLGTPRTVHTAPYSIQRQAITIAIGAQTKYDKFIDPDTRRKRDALLRKPKITLDPYQPAHLSVAPAFVLGFVRNPEFTAVKDGDAFKIQKKDAELTRYSAGVMVNITPDKWQEPTFGGHFQLGITPVKDALGFFFGAGIKAQGIFSFGGGLMLQQVRRLADGLSLESRLDDPAKLKLDREFKRGLYLHVTVNIPK